MTGRNGNRRLSKDERALWKTVTKAIKPIRAPALDIDEPEPDDEPAPSLRVKMRTAKSAPLAPKPEPPPTSPPPLAPLDRRMKQRVARGKQPIDGRLDLHGMTQNEAYAALARFLGNASARDAKLVLVITGKGGRGQGGGAGERGVLRRQVPQWLGLPEFRSLVIGFEQASISHGGEGALYVRVRRVK
jgi:DNA-nicking Smr family endonuclease